MTAYETALAAHDEAFKIYNAARDAYGANKIGEAEFIAARTAFDAATKIFDEAYAAAQDAPIAEIDDDDSQLFFFA